MTKRNYLVVAVEALVGDDGTGDNGVIIDTALAENPNVTAAEIAEIIYAARADARAEREHMDR